MEPRIHRLGKSAFAVIGREGATNFGIVRAEDSSAFLIDADIRRIDEIEEALTQTGCARVSYLFNTHENFDHSSANCYFIDRGVPVVSSEGCWQVLKEDGEEKFVEMAGRSPELWTRFPNLKMGLPVITFSESATVHLPGITIRLIYYGQSHSRGDAVAFLEQEEILFAGDLLCTEVHPVTIYGNITNWMGALGVLLQSRFKVIVPGHGPMEEGQKAGKDALLKFHKYLEDFYSQLMEARSGRKGFGEVERHMTGGNYASLGKTRMVKRNIEYFLREEGKK